MSKLERASDMVSRRSSETSKTDTDVGFSFAPASLFLRGHRVQMTSGTVVDQGNFADRRAQADRAADRIGGGIRYQAIVIRALVELRIEGLQAERVVALPPAILRADDARVEAGIEFRTHANLAAPGTDADPIAVADSALGRGLRMHADLGIRRAAAQRGNMAVLAVTIMDHLGAGQHQREFAAGLVERRSRRLDESRQRALAGIAEHFGEDL